MKHCCEVSFVRCKKCKKIVSSKTIKMRKILFGLINLTTAKCKRCGKLKANDLIFDK